MLEIGSFYIRFDFIEDSIRISKKCLQKQVYLLTIKANAHCTVHHDCNLSTFNIDDISLCPYREQELFVLLKAGDIRRYLNH